MAITPLHPSDIAADVIYSRSTPLRCYQSASIYGIGHITSPCDLELEGSSIFFAVYNSSPWHCNNDVRVNGENNGVVVQADVHQPPQLQRGEQANVNQRQQQQQQQQPRKQKRKTAAKRTITDEETGRIIADAVKSHLAKLAIRNLR